MGAVGNFINAVVVAEAVTYLLSATGRDKAALKGIGVGALFWMVVDGLFMGFVQRGRERLPIAPLLSLLDHMVSVGACALLIAKLGDDSLFPERGPVGTAKKTPLVHTGMTK